MVKFLIIRLSSIGDIVLTTPVIRMLKNQVEDTEIHYLLKPQYQTILEGNPHITRIHSLSENMMDSIKELQAESFDYIIDLQNNLRSRSIKQALKRMYFTVNKLNFRKWLYVNLKLDYLPDMHIVDRYLDTLKLFDVNNDGEGLDYFIPPGEEIHPESLGKEFRSGYIAFAIGAQHATKILPTEMIIDIIGKLDYPVILIGGKEDQDKGNEITTQLKDKALLNACGKWSINQSASIIRQANCVIGHDSGMAHIAAAFQKKLISIWGNTTPRFGMKPYLPDNQSVIYEVPDLSCRPCSKLGKKKCPRKHFKCMHLQDVSSIASMANRIYGE